jgi:hypothetical protein
VPTVRGADGAGDADLAVARTASRRPPLDGPGQEGIARGQELPVSWDLDISVLGIPRAILGCVDVEMLSCESLGIERGFRVVHT